MEEEVEEVEGEELSRVDSFIWDNLPAISNLMDKDLQSFLIVVLHLTPTTAVNVNPIPSNQVDCRKL